jgi:hypothetical protein
MLPAAIQAEILRLTYAEHWGPSRIARHLGIHRQSVRKVARRLVATPSLLLFAHAHGASPAQSVPRGCSAAPPALQDPPCPPAHQRSGPSASARPLTPGLLTPHQIGLDFQVAPVSGFSSTLDFVAAPRDKNP